MSLISVMVALAMVGVLAMVVMELARVSNSQTKRTQLKGEGIAIRRMLDERMNCAATFSTTYGTSNGIADAGLQTCKTSNGRLASIFDKDGNEIVKSSNTSPTRIGRFTVRAFCDTTNQGLRIQIARPKPDTANPLSATSDSDFFDQPEVHKAMSWANATDGNGRNLYPLGALPCHGYFSVTTGITPKGKCQIIQYPVLRATPPESNSDYHYISCNTPSLSGQHCGWTTHSMNCSNPAFPVAMGISPNPSAYARGWQTAYNYDANGVPIGGSCSILFLEDADEAGRHAFYQSQDAATKAAMRASTCQLVCCDL